MTLTFNNMPTAVVFLDIEKAFDTTWHNGLLYKLSASLIKLISSFLSNTTAVVFLDIEKAFDTTWHNGLLYKLSASLIKLISSFLSNRKLSVSVEGEMSTPRIMKAGVPQGSALSPTLFNMYINDTPQTIGVHLALFADDTCLHAIDLL
jgi:hypothetical protein